MDELKENENGELNANVMILDNMVIFFDEYKLTNEDLERIKRSQKRLDYMSHKYGTLDIWELMDKRCSHKEMVNYLIARYTLRRYNVEDGCGKI